MMKYHFLLVYLMLIFSVGYTQQWYSGVGTSTGTDLEKVKQKAVLKARISALEQAGINIRSNTVSLKNDSRDNIVDIYGAFAESDAMGVIVAERNLIIKTSIIGEKSEELIQVKISLEAEVVVPDGKPDPTFAVTLTSDKDYYYEGDDLQLSLTSTKDGFLTIFQIKNDSCFVIYPHPKLPKTYQNYIKAKQITSIPPKGKPYSYELNLEGGDGKTTIENIVSVVTQEPIPIDAGYNKEYLTIYEYSNWLSKIPIHLRSSASIIISIVKK